MCEQENEQTSRRGVLKWGAVLPAAAALASTGLAAGAAEAAGDTPAFAPLPEQARPLPMPKEGYRLDRVGDALYAVTAGGNQAAFLVTSAGVVVIDAPPSLATALPAAIKRVTRRPVTHLVYSHSHADHIGGASTFGDVVRVAHADTAHLLRADHDPGRPQPTVTFRDRYDLRVGDQHLRLSYPGPNHESGNILIHAPRQRTAIMIDLVLPGWSPFRAWGTADSVPGVIRAHDQLVKMDIDTYIGGHVHRIGTARDVKDSHEFVHDLWNATATALANTNSADYFAKVEPGNNWAGFRLYLEAIADKVEPAIRRKWLGRLAAVDVFTRENVITMALSQFVDAPKDV